MVSVALRLPLLAAGIAATQLHAAPAFCVASLLADASKVPTAYAVRGDGRYCEGTVVLPNSGGIHLVGVHLGELTNPPTKQLTLSVPNGLLRGAAARMVAIDATRETNYRLDAEISDGNVLAVDSATVLTALKIDVSRVAFLGSIVDQRALKTYVPTQLTSSHTGKGEVTAIFFASDPLRRLRIVVTDDRDSIRQQPDTVLDDPPVRSPVRVPIGRTEIARTVILKAIAFGPVSNDPVSSRTYRMLIPGTK